MMRVVLIDVFDTVLEPCSQRAPLSDLVLAGGLKGTSAHQAMRLLMTKPFDNAQGAATLIEQSFPSVVFTASMIATAQAALEADTQSDEYLVVNGAERVLNELRDLELLTCLVSNVASPYRKVIEALGVRNMVTDTAYSCDVGSVKPEPEIFLFALKLMKASPDQAIMVGDNEIDDIQGASALGMQTFLVDNSGKGRGKLFGSFSAYIRGCLAEYHPS